MTRHEQSLQLTDTGKNTVLALAFQVMKNMGWPVLYAGDNYLVAKTVKKWNKYPQEITCTVEESMLTIKSKMTHGEMLDLAGSNKKNCRDFMTAFEELLHNRDESMIEKNKDEVIALQIVTNEKAMEEEKDAAAVAEAMNLGGSNLYITYTIIGINLLVFILMAIDGAGIFAPEGYIHIKWGSNYTPLTLSGDWWRLITNTFIHFGIIHILMNMYCLYTVGVYLEPMLGKIKYATGYLSTGILASLVSLWWHQADGANSAGASGAVFGIYGIFLALLTTNLIPKSVRQPLLQSIVIFVVYNLVYGVKSGVDNAAHVGGLLSGFIIGYLYVLSIKKEKQQQQFKWVVPVIIAATAAISVFYLQQNKVSVADRTKALNDVATLSFKDNTKFNEKLGEFDKIQEDIRKAVEDTSLTNELLIQRINGTGLPLLEKATTLVNAANQYDISPIAHQKATKILAYIELRKQDLGILKQMAENNSTNELMPKLNEVRKKENDLFEDILKM